MQTIVPMDPPLHCEGLTLKGMVCARDGDVERKVFVMGSVLGFPLITSIIIR